MGTSKTWTIKLSKKQVDQLPDKIRMATYALLNEIRHEGPLRANWHNYRSLSGDRYHAHLKKGDPTYFCMWEIVDKKNRLVKVCYVGTNEKTPDEYH